MRAIKFRAWYRGKMWRYVEHCTYPDGSSDVNCLGYREDGRMFSPGGDVELMQFTGLLDKNDKEIYEGDIVEVDVPYGDKERVQVLWGKVAPMYEWMTGETWLLSRFANGNEGPLYPYCQPTNGYDVLVIGNIYQNPELLEA